MNEKLKTISMADVAVQEVQWLWYPYIPIGKITILQGDPGDGKTTLVLAITALLSQGLALPEQNNAAPPMTVIYQTAEDGIADTIKPRLIKAGADCARVVVIDDSDSPLTICDERIEKAIVKERAKLLILDPLQAFLGANIDMHRANQVRPAFMKLAGMAERTKCAVVIIGHMNKMSGAKSIYRGLGSVDIPAVARSILYVGKGDDTTRYMAHLKSSLAPFGATIAFDLADTVEFLGTSPLTVNDILSGYSRLILKRGSAINIIEEMIGENEVPCQFIYERCKSEGISKRTVEEAKAELGVISVKKGNHWYWKL